MSILIVENDSASREKLKSILSKNDFRVEVRASGQEAWEYLVAWGPCELIIASAIMPEMDGIELVRKVSQDKRFGRIPSILCSSSIDKTQAGMELEAEMSASVTKPVTEEELIPRVVETLEKYPGSVLVVDDEEVIRLVLVQVLRREGYPVLSAESGKEALDLIEQEKVSVLLSDIAMAEMNGLELMSRTREVNSKIRVILTSGEGREIRDQVMSAGADDFISKPFHYAEVLASIRCLYGKSV